MGDLRGVKALFGETLTRARSIASCRSTGGGVNITHVAVGSHRYRVTFKGPGGHSYGAFGLANPVGALGRAVAKIVRRCRCPRNPRTTFNVGRIGGGTSVNSIPFEAWMEVDLRSSSAAALAALDANFHSRGRRGGGGREPALVATRDRHGRSRSSSAIAPRARLRQRRPSSRQRWRWAAPLASHAALSEGSTDANLPMSLKIPAITIGGGGTGRDAHALTESFDSTDSWKGTQNALLLAIALAQSLDISQTS